MEFKLTIDREVLKEYDYKTAKIAGFKTLTQLGLPSGYFGGRIHRIAELKDSEVKLLLDHISNVIGILEPLKKQAVKKEVVKEEVIENELVENSQEELMACEFCNKEFKNKFGLQAHQRFCKDK